MSLGADPLWIYFSAVAGQDGQIDAEELQRSLTSSGISGNYKPFSLETCKLMLAMLDQDYSGSMGFEEFKNLSTALTGWKQHFIRIDVDRSGTVEGPELNQALASMGYQLSPAVMSAIVRRFGNTGKIGFDEFVACCVKLRALTDNFRRRDTTQQGKATFAYDDFIQVTIGL
uniref:sorcin-like isoform X2 n=1 Tax=Myxine glutinosa TaxID=7769 RepID=UPI00358FE4AA